jgi:hypothetical protein
MRTLEERERRLGRVRIASRIEMALGGFGVVATVFFAFQELFASPQFGETLYTFPPASVLGVTAFYQLIAVACAAVAVLGYAWMLRIRYADPEQRSSNWLSHWGNE